MPWKIPINEATGVLKSQFDMTQIIIYFYYINRVANALGVEPEEFIPLWGK